MQADGRKATFFYIADGRVDFRELIKIYASEFKVKVEMRQIGARQEAGKVGGIGSCGRELCCSTWLTDFKSVNTAAARYQNLSINQTKLSGQCGRLKCCLNYELDTYLDALQHFPDNCDVIKVAKGNAFLVKKDIFKNLMWYTLPDNNKQYPLSIERVVKIKSLNQQGVFPEELEPVEITSSKPKEIEPEFADLVGQISLQTLEKAEKKRHFQQQKQKGQERGQGQRPQQKQQPANENRQQQTGNPQPPESRGNPADRQQGNQQRNRPQRPPGNQGNNQGGQQGAGNQGRPQRPQGPRPPRQGPPQKGI